jgi:integrase
MPCLLFQGWPANASFSGFGWSEFPGAGQSHTLRHSAATLVGAETGSELVVQHLLGHSTPVHTRKYIHKKGKSVSKAVAALHAAMSRKHDRKRDDDPS